MAQKVILLVFTFVTTLFASGGVVLGYGAWFSEVTKTVDYFKMCDGWAKQASTCHLKDKDGNVEKKEYKCYGDGKNPCLECAKVKNKAWAKECAATQNSNSQLIFNAAFQSLSFSSVVAGLGLDRFGPKIVATIGLMCATAGNVMMATGTFEGSGWIVIMIAYCLIAAGGIGPYIASMHICILFKNPPLIINTIVGLFNGAGCVYILYAVTGVSRESFWLVMSIVSGACGLGCFLIYPKDAYAPGDKCDLLRNIKWEESEKEEDPDAETKPLTEGDPNATSEKKSLSDFIRTPKLIWLCVWYAVGALWISYMGGAIPARMVELGDFKEGHALPKGLMTTWMYPIIGNAAWLWNPVVTYIMKTPVLGFGSCIALNNIAIVAAVIFLLINNLYLQFATLVMYSIVKALLFGALFAYINLAYPGHLYGTIVALATGVAGVLGLSTFAIVPLVKAVWDSHPDWMMVILIALMMPTFYLCVLVFNDQLHDAKILAKRKEVNN